MSQERKADDHLVPVYNWVQEGQWIGCGTVAEFEYWASEGMMNGVTQGSLLTFEPASEDTRRAAAWARECRAS